MKTPAPLSPAARRLLELGARVEPPTPEQSERLARALEPLFRPELPAPPSPPLARPERPRVLRRARGALRLGSTQVVLGALAATASAAFWLGRVSTEPAAPAAPRESRPPRADSLSRINPRGCRLNATRPRPAFAAIPPRSPPHAQRPRATPSGPPAAPRLPAPTQRFLPLTTGTCHTA